MTETIHLAGSARGDGKQDCELCGKEITAPGLMPFAAGAFVVVMQLGTGRMTMPTNDPPTCKAFWVN